MKHYNRGFTLLELMITLAIVSAVVIMGVPNFKSTIRNSRLTAAINELSASMNLARSEAIKRNRSVTVRKKAGGDWQSGWIVFVDINANGSLDGAGDAAACDAGNDCLLKDHEALSSNFSLSPNNIAFNNYISYKPSGISNAGMVKFYLCDTSSDSSITPLQDYTNKVLILNAVGRPRMAVASDNITTCTPP